MFKEHPKSIAGILKHYSPPNENQTGMLIRNLSRRTGFSPHQELDLTDSVQAAKMAYGIAVQEGKAREGSRKLSGTCSLMRGAGSIKEACSDIRIKTCSAMPARPA